MMKQMKTANMVSSNSNWHHLLILYTVVCFLYLVTDNVCQGRSNMTWSQCSRRNLKFIFLLSVGLIRVPACAGNP